jgi:hypothetical protein
MAIGSSATPRIIATPGDLLAAQPKTQQLPGALTVPVGGRRPELAATVVPFHAL